MGWKGYKSEIAIGMLFRRMYCYKCATKLKIKKHKRLVEKGDGDFVNGFPGGPKPIGMTSYTLARFAYICPNCNLEITYDEQCIIAKKQKHLKTKILF